MCNSINDKDIWIIWFFRIAPSEYLSPLPFDFFGSAKKKDSFGLDCFAEQPNYDGGDFLLKGANRIFPDGYAELTNMFCNRDTILDWIERSTKFRMTLLLRDMFHEFLAHRGHESPMFVQLADWRLATEFIRLL
jgi:hypothetical protein